MLLQTQVHLVCSIQVASAWRSNCVQLCSHCGGVNASLLLLPPPMPSPLPPPSPGLYLGRGVPLLLAAISSSTSPTFLTYGTFLST